VNHRPAPARQPGSADSGAAVFDLSKHRITRSTDPSTADPAPDPAVDSRPDPVRSGSADPRTAGRRVDRAIRTARTAHRIATSPQARSAARLAVRHGMYLGGGMRIVARRMWSARTAARYERMMQAAEAAGQHEQALEWEERGRQFRADRHRRRMDLLTAPARVARAGAIGAITGTGVLLALGGVMAWSTGSWADILTPLLAVIQAVYWAVVIISIVWGPAIACAPFLALLGLWAVGRHAHAAPAWTLPTRPAAGGRGESVPDEGAILNALRHLGIAPLGRAFKQGWQPRWAAPTTRLGKGWHTQLQLPLGVTVEMINAKKPVLAHNLLRLPIEVWPTEPRDQPGVMDLWVADQGSLSGAVPPWPLLEGGKADYFATVPAGVSQRGEPVAARLMAANYMVGGIMGSGKSSLVIGLLLGALLDPLVEAEVYVMAYNIDYDPLTPRLNVLVKGDEDEQVEAALEALRNLRDEVTERGKLLAELGGETPKLTRDLAERDPRMRPKLVVFDECHELFMHKKHGPEAAELAVKVMKKARKLGITLIWATVSPTADSIPKDVTRNTSHRVAFAVGDHVANDGLLGTGKHKAGITATTLSPAEDIGTALTVGFTKNAFELIRTHYLRKDSAVDQITPVVQRALEYREGITPATTVAAGEDRPDPLADIAAILGDAKRMRTEEVRQRLTERNPAVYRNWTAQQLAAVLDTAGAPVRKSDGVKVVSRDRVLAALADRDATPDGD
jgi:S-DNA-T family DNA segregation ATPase FtsK/SpoIIIE